MHISDQSTGRQRPPLQRGFSLIELMISTAIALVITIAMMQLLLNVLQVDRVSTDVARMQESGRNTLELMGRAIRQAGARSDADQPFAGEAITGSNGVDSAADTLTLQFDAQDGGEADCKGIVVAGGSMLTQAFVVNAAVTPPVLTCNGATVADNIEDLQIFYGIDSTRDGSIDAYVSAPSAAQFAQVAAVRVNLLVKAASAGTATNRSQSYLYNGVSVSRDDGYLRQVYSATFTARNQAR